MKLKSALIFSTVISASCNSNGSKNMLNPISINKEIEYKTDINPYPFVKKIPTPKGFARQENENNSFAFFLKNLSLKENTTVYLYNKQPKANQSAQFAIIDIPIGEKNLQQCADAVMRLRAEYLYEQKRFDEIIFIDNENTSYTFKPPYSKINFTKYLERVFGMCGTASLSKQLKEVNIFTNIKAGDVLIRGGFPGHAVLVLDIAENKEGKKIFLLAQSYMPAQDIQILNNPNNAAISPWYEIPEGNTVATPEYIFTKKELKTW